MIYENFDGGPNSLDASQREFMRNQDNAEFGAPSEQTNEKQIRRETLLEVAELAYIEAEKYLSRPMIEIAFDKFAQELERLATIEGASQAGDIC